MIQVNTQLTQQDFIRFNYGHFFRNPFIKGLIGIFSFVFLASIFNMIMTRMAGQAEGSIFENLVSLLLVPGIIAASCWSVYSQSKRSYASTNSIHEPITYTFSHTGILVKGRSFESHLNWNVIHKVQETKNWFVLHQNNVAVNLVPKTSFENQDQIKDLRTIIASQQGLKHKLRKD